MTSIVEVATTYLFCGWVSSTLSSKYLLTDIVLSAVLSNFVFSFDLWRSIMCHYFQRWKTRVDGCKAGCSHVITSEEDELLIRRNQSERAALVKLVNSAN